MFLSNTSKKMLGIVGGKILIVDNLTITTAVKTGLSEIKSDMKNGISFAKTLPSKIVSGLNVPAIDVSKYNDIITETLSKVKLKATKSKRVLKKYGYQIAGEVLTKLGNSTVDDEVITNIIVTALVAAAGSMSGTAGTYAAEYVTSATLTPLLEGAFKYIDSYQVKKGAELTAKGKNL